MHALNQKLTFEKCDLEQDIRLCHFLLILFMDCRFSSCIVRDSKSCEQIMPQSVLARQPRSPGRQKMKVSDQMLALLTARLP
jgi:hypothetical protein